MADRKANSVPKTTGVCDPNKKEGKEKGPFPGEPSFEEIQGIDLKEYNKKVRSSLFYSFVAIIFKCVSISSLGRADKSDCPSTFLCIMSGSGCILRVLTFLSNKTHTVRVMTGRFIAG